jgi:membrane protease YdiL (CAAX protease family)
MLPDGKKRAVPWTGIDVFLFFVLWAGAQVGCQVFCFHFIAPPVDPQNQAVNTSGENEHPLVPLIQYEKNSPLVLFVAFLTAAVSAPLTEEFLFRLLLQGWLETKLYRFSLPARYPAVIIVSLIFAAIHGGNRTTMDTETLYYVFASYAAANLMLFAAGIAYLILVRKMTMSECLFGTDRQFFHPRFFTYAGYCLGAIFLIYVLNIIVNVSFSGYNTDPIPVFVLSVILGILYSRTRNLSYCVLMHACLNGISLLLVYLACNPNYSCIIYYK